MTALPQDESYAAAEYFSNKGKSQLEWDFAWHWLRDGYATPPMLREYKFHPTRKWQIDFAIPSLKIAVEIEGGEWSRGRHTRGQGFIDDCEKYNAAALLGWEVLRFPGTVIKRDCAGAVEDVKAAIRQRKRSIWPGLRAELRATQSPIKARRQPCIKKLR